MDVNKIGRILPFGWANGTKKSKESAEREPQQGGQSYSGGDQPASKDEANKAATKLKGSDHFLENSLSVEVREFDGKFFLDVFDPQRRKIKTIGGIGIRAIISSYNAGSSKSKILDKRV